MNKITRIVAHLLIALSATVPATGWAEDRVSFDGVFELFDRIAPLSPDNARYVEVRFAKDPARHGRFLGGFLTNERADGADLITHDWLTLRCNRDDHGEYRLTSQLVEIKDISFREAADAIFAEIRKLSDPSKPARLTVVDSIESADDFYDRDLSTRTEALLVAWAAKRRSEAKLSEQSLSFAAKLPAREYDQGTAAEQIMSELQLDVLHRACRLLQHPAVTRSDVLRNLDVAIKLDRLPEERERVEQMVATLKEMSRTTWPATDDAPLAVEELKHKGALQAAASRHRRYLVYRLREENLHDGFEVGPYADVLACGKAIVPELLDAVTDRSLTRTLALNNFIVDNRIMTVGQMAWRALHRILGPAMRNLEQPETEEERAQLRPILMRAAGLDK
jgi:hypothetical protein